LTQAGQITPVLVTDEQSAGFLADGVARSGGPMACVNVVPGAGMTHCLSGVAEAFMDGVPMLVLTCGIRRDSPYKFQLHDVDQLAIAAPVCKGTFRPLTHAEIVPMILQAGALAISGCPGPVVVEIPANLYLLRGAYDPAAVAAVQAGGKQPAATVDPAVVTAIATMLRAAKQPLLHVGLGAADAGGLIGQLSQALGAVVSTTFSGKGVVAESDPLWLWPGFGTACPAPLRQIAADCDAALVLGARLGEVSTASYGISLPEASAHVDIDPSVPGANFPVRYQVVADAKTFATALLAELQESAEPEPDTTALRQRLYRAHQKVAAEQAEVGDASRVQPHTLFAKVQATFGPLTVYATDSGNGTFLAAEHLRLQYPRQFLAPTDFSCMGYCLPAAMGAAFAHPGQPVVGFAGDGALLMTGLELLTASQHKLPVALFVLRDGELGQIAAFQRTLTNAAPCSVLPDYNLEALAAVASVPYRACATDQEVEAAVQWALATVQAGQPAVVGVHIDYSRKTYFTKGVVKANFGRLAWPDRLRMLGRAAWRRVG
jgi:acetolactate synthase-1/2/3 large subunit